MTSSTKGKGIAVELADGLTVQASGKRQANAVVKAFAAFDSAVGHLKTSADEAITAREALLKAFGGNTANKGYQAALGFVCAKHGMTVAALKQAAYNERKRQAAGKSRNQGGKGITKTRKATQTMTLGDIAKRISADLATVVQHIGDDGTSAETRKAIRESLESWFSAIDALDEATKVDADAENVA